MSYQSRIVWIVCLLIGVLPALAYAQQLQQPAPAPQAPEGPTEAQKALAERFVAIAQESLQGTRTPEVFARAAALIEAALKLDPKEQRYWRLLVEARAGAGDDKGVEEALVRLLDLNPTNSAVYVQLMYVYLGRMEALDAKLDYLMGDLNNPGRPGVIRSNELPAQVRSAAAAVAAQLAVDKGDMTQARLLVQKALELNAVNPLAAELNWKLTQDSADQIVRTKAAITLVHAQPRRGDNLVTLARQLNEAGFVREAQTWYLLAFQLQGRPPALIPELAAAMYVMNNPMDADRFISQLLAADPNHVDGWFMRLLLDKSSDNREALQADLAKARGVLVAQLAAVRDRAGVAAAGGAAAAPVDATVPDLAADLEKLKAGNVPADVQADYATAVHDLLWAELYFAGPSPTTDRLLTFMRGALPENHPTLVRLEGWNFLLQNKPDEARVKLSAVADRDPLAAVALTRLVDRRDDAAMTKMTEEATALLGRNSAGLTGAFLVTELRPFGVQMRVPEAVRPVERQVIDFSRDFPRIYDQPSAFYQLKARVVGVAHPVGRPMIGEVELTNVLGYDLSIDPAGAIDPSLLFDARLQGIAGGEISGIAIDNLAQGLVLPARQTIVQQVRLDQPRLAGAINQNPRISYQIQFVVTTNATTVRDEQDQVLVVPGPLGQRREFRNLIERTPMPIEILEREVAKAFNQGNEAAKIQTLDLIRAYLPLVGQFLQASQQDPNVPPQQVTALQQLVPSLRGAVNRQMQDPSAPVRVWAGYTMAQITTGAEQAEVLRQMRGSDDWTARALSLAALSARPAAEAEAIAGRLTGEDQDPVVRKLAEATVALAKLPPATQPAPQPDASDPAAAPAVPQ